MKEKMLRVKVIMLLGGLSCIGNGEEVVSQHLSYAKAVTRFDSIAIVEWYSKNESNPGLLKEAYEANKANGWLRKYGILSGLGAAMLSVAAANQVQDCKGDPGEKDCASLSGASIIGAGVGSVLIILGVGSYFYTPKAERNFMASILDPASTRKNQSGGSHKEELDKP